jgi:tRNA1Val (adenine37-N6)-methyltransferase
VRQAPGYDFFRSMLYFSRRSGGIPEAKESLAPVETELTIKDGSGKYTEEFTELMKDYYLYL